MHKRYSALATPSIAVPSQIAMKKHIAAFFWGLGLSLLVGLGIYGVRNRGEIGRNARDIARRGRQRGRRVAERGRLMVRRGQQFAGGLRQTGMDLNSASFQDLMSLGLDRLMAERIIENRPYRSRLDLVSRVVIPSDIYDGIKHRISVSRPDEGVKVAS